MIARSRKATVLAGIFTLSLLAAACGDDSSGSSATTAAGTATTTAGAATTAASGGATTTSAASSSKLEGEITISGSSTVEPITSAVAEAFKAKNSKVAISVDGPGTGDGFKLFCTGETDISDASRKIKDEEAAACKSAGVEYVELKVAFDGLTVATSPKNTAVACLDIPALYALTGPESTGFAKWSDAQALATKLGTKVTTFPDAKLDIYGPGEESGTYDSFVEFAITKLAGTQGIKEVATRADYNSSPNDNTIISGIEGSDTSLGWVGFAYAQEQKGKVKELAVDGGKGCVAPTAATIADGTYPFSRGLYIYVNKAKATKTPAVKAFVDYYLSADGIKQVSEVGYVDLPADQLKASTDAWAAMG